MVINGVSVLWVMAEAAIGKATETERVFLDPEGRFELSLPSSWSQYTKPGAEVLFKRPDRGSTNVGVTITPVKVRKLDDFGSLEDIRERLFKAEQEKDGFIEIELKRETAQEAGMGVPFDVISYEVESVRGKKRIITGVTISDYFLYIVNGTCKAQFSEDFGVLEGIVKSFKLRL